METKGRPKVASFEEALMQQAHLQLRGGKQEETEVGDGRTDAARANPKRPAVFSQSCFCRFSWRLLKGNPVFSPMASAPPLVFCLAQKEDFNILNSALGDFLP